MDDRELYWKKSGHLGHGKDEPVFYTPNVKGVHSWTANYEPNYAGKGPKGYQRPDVRVLEDINDGLTRSPYVDATDVNIEVNQGIVTLSGKVVERRAKHIAEEIAYYVPGVREVRNHIRVTRFGDRE